MSDDLIPASIQQQGILSEIELKNGALNYQIAKAIKVFTPLSAQKLRNAFYDTLARHPALTSTFHLYEGTWHFRVRKAHEDAFVSITLSKELSYSFDKIASIPFDLENGPLFKLHHIYHLSDEYIYISAHHLIVDLWSIGIFLEELFALYRQDHLDSHAIDYQTYSFEQNLALKGDSYHSAIEYWQSLSKPFFGPVGNISGDLQGVYSHAPQMRMIPFNLPRTSADQIYSLTRKYRTRPVSLLMATFAYMLFLSSSNTKVCFSTTSHGRNNKKYTRTIGLFSSLTPIFSEIDLFESFIDYAQRLQKQIISCLKKHSMPFYILSKQLGLSSQQSFQLALENMFVFQQVPSVSGELKKLSLPAIGRDRIHWNGFELESSTWNYPFSAYNFTMYLNELEKGFGGFIEYDQRFFSHEKINSLLGLYISITDFFSARPKLKPIDFERYFPSKVLVESDHTTTIIKQFQANVKKNQSKIIGYEDKQAISFAQLDKLSNQYARYLVSLKILPNSIVALHIDNKIDTLIAIIGAWKLGITIVPIDITTEEKRKEEILSKCNPDYIIEDIPVSKLHGFSKKPLSLSPCGQSIAYIIYTSGSTGSPKGVAVSHKALLSYLNAIHSRYHFKCDVHFAAYSSISFDLSLTSICYPLLFGHSVHFYSRQGEIADTLEKILQNPLLSHIKCTPSHLKILQSLDTSNSSLQELIVGGEQLASDLTRQTFENFKSLKAITNEYGPTEATVGCIAYTVYKNTQHSCNIVPIGTTLSNSEALLLCPSYADIAEVNTSELYIGGECLAIVYWDDPMLTAEKFIPHPYNPGKRLYRSGDICTRDVRSIYTYSGRIDNQVKLRGYRVELGEIESKIKLCPHVKDTIVLCQKDDRNQSQQLIAYCILERGKEISCIKKHAQEILPRHMTPSKFIECKLFPLTQNGKVDTALLEKEHTLSPSKMHLPLSPMELDVQKMCAEILGIPPKSLSLNHSFFELGGDSISAIQFISILKKNGWNITSKQLLSELSIREIIAKQNYSLDSNNRMEAFPIEKIPLTPMQTWFFNAIQGNLNHYNQAIMLYPYTRFDFRKVNEALKSIERQFPLLKSFFPDKYNARLSADRSFTVDKYTIGQGEDESIEIEKIKNCMMKSMDITSGPLFLAAYIHSLSRDVLIFVAHHLVIDGVSWHLILNAFNQYYTHQKNCFSEQKYIANLHSYCKYYSQQYYDFSYLLPEDRYSISDQHHYTHSIPLNDLHPAIIELDTRKLEELLLTAFAYSLNSLRISKSMAIHVEGHGRPNLDDIASTTGWFTLLKSVDLEDVVHDISTIQEVVHHQLHQENSLFVPSNTLFNFLGKNSSQKYNNFSYSPVWSGLVDKKNKIPYSLILNVLIKDGELQLHLSFDEKTYIPEILESEVKRIHRLLSDSSLINAWPKVLEKICVNVRYKDWVEVEKHILPNLDLLPSDLECISPLLPSQKGMYQYMMQHPASRNYHQQLLLKFTGFIPDTQVQSIYKATLQHFPGLRTFYQHSNLSEPYKFICKEIPVDFFLIHGDINEYIIEDQNKLFDINKPPLIRLGYQGDQQGNKFCLVLTYHHLIMDGWGLSNFFKYFMEVLKKVLCNQQVESQALSPLVPKQTRATTKDKRYWSDLISDFSHPSSLPKSILLNSGLPSTKTFTATIKQDTLYLLQNAATQSEVTISSLLHAFWTYLISCYSGEEDIVFGTVLSGRSDFSNIDAVESVDQLSITIPIRIKICNKKNFFEISSEIQKQILESEQSLSLSTGEILSCSRLNRELFDHIVVMENYPFSGNAQQLIDKQELPLKVEHCEVHESSHYPFSISFIPADGLHLEIQYDPSIYDACFIEGIARNLESIIKQFLINKNISVGEISLEPKYSQSIALPLIHHSSIIESFSEQAYRTPDSIALIFGDHHLSFEQLDTLSTKLAIFLLSQGLQQEDLVGIKMRKSIEWVIVWLGIQKAGGTYVPFDSEVKMERLSGICKRYDLKYLFLDKKSKELICSKTFQWGEIVKLINNLPNLSLPVLLYDQLAYVLFTSGSTGVPKGIAMHHGAISSHFQWTKSFFNLSEMDRMLQLTAVTFDVSVCELYSIASGATLVIPNFGKHMSTQGLFECISANQITFLQMVPSLLETLLLPDYENNHMSSVRQLLCGADILKPEDLLNWNKKFGIPITNLYGLTETCIDSTYFCCGHLKTLLKVIPIGRPIQNTLIHILGKSYNMLPNNASGYLFIEGQGVGRGYFKDPQKTAEKFIPALRLESTRMFATNDRAYRLDNDNIVFQGRSDNQVKLRGLRIELDEVRLAVLQCRGVEDAIVKVVKNGPNQTLCCYYTGIAELNEETARLDLSKKIPHYMIPSTFIKLKKLPLNSHGKIDANKLPVSKQVNLQSFDLSDLELEILKIWSKHLNTPLRELNPEHSFFEQGGNSLLIMKIHQELNKQLSLNLPITTLFEYPSIRTLSRFITGGSTQKLENSDTQLRIQSRKKRNEMKSKSKNLYG